MKFFFPDSHDLVDPSFDFNSEQRSSTRVRHQDDQYAHEVFDEPPYSGLLVSKAIVDGTEKGAGKYTTAQRLRLLRLGVREFFRLHDRPLETMGDCGAFSYVKEKHPPYTVDEVLSFYEQCRFDFGISVDHIILGFQPDDADDAAIDPVVLEDFRSRQSITLELARQFLARHKKLTLPFIPMGVAQGWSPRSYADSVKQLQRMGYRYIAIGGLVPLKTDEILASLRKIDETRRRDTQLHLLGVIRLVGFDMCSSQNANLISHRRICWLDNPVEKQTELFVSDLKIGRLQSSLKQIEKTPGILAVACEKVLDNATASDSSLS